MKVDVVCTKKSKYSKIVASEAAKWARTYCQTIDTYNRTSPSDLLVICFDDSFFKENELVDFIKSLSRQQVKNLALVHCFYFNDRKLKRVVKLCQDQQLPLMREQYIFKMTKDQLKEIHPSVIDNVRIYIEDMMNIIRNYY